MDPAAWVGAGCLVLLGVSAPGFQRSPGLLIAIFATAATLGVHAVFFGAGRYSLVLLPLWAALAAAALGRSSASPSAGF